MATPRGWRNADQLDEIDATRIYSLLRDIVARTRAIRRSALGDRHLEVTLGAKCHEYSLGPRLANVAPLSMLSYLGYLGAALVLVVGLTLGSKLLRRSPASDPRYIVDRGNPLRRWAQGALATYRGNVGDPGYWTREAALSEMVNSWSTPDRDELVRLLESYRQGELNPAFDKIRIIWLARVAYGCGWFDEATSWQWVQQAANVIRFNYQSWDHVAADVLAGAIAWQREFNDYTMTPSDIANRRAIAEEAKLWVWPAAPFELAF